tara:strand:- start:6090 stop:6983 length:894 start_codon:yes stop_codon:yes gene_type:complete
MNREELIRYNDFLLMQIDLTRKRVIKPIYRGDSLNNLCEKLNVTFKYENTDIPTVLERLFMVGEKAQRFYTDDDNFNINETSDYVFEKIMKYFKASLKNKNTNTVTFFNRNTTLRDFFSDKSNKALFLNKIESVTENERIAIRNYYLVLLHQLASINYKNKSHFISTSRDYAIAEKFSINKLEPHRIILHCWQPIKMENNIIRKYNLPSYSVGPYHYQKESTILGGILPHFISGLELTSTKDFFPNPNIFNADITNKIFLKGLEIDQINFHEIANLTNYKRTLSTDGIAMWENKTSR